MHGERRLLTDIYKISLVSGELLGQKIDIDKSEKLRYIPYIISDRGAGFISIGRVTRRLPTVKGDTAEVERFLP